MKQNPKLRSDNLAMDLCFRIERMCRYSPLDTKEVDGQTMKDRGIVEGLYVFYRKEGQSEEVSARFARANAIRLIMCEALS